MEPSPPPGRRPTPATSVGMSGAEIPTYNPAQMEKIKRNLDIIFNEKNDPNNKKYKQMISRVLGTTPNVTSEDYELIFGGPYTQLIPVHLLLDSFRIHFSDLDTDEAFEFACRAYRDDLSADSRTIYNLKLSDRRRFHPYPYPTQPKTIYVIARLMRSYATDVFDRTPHGGKSRLRSKKRGRKSIHRRKKSMHKKRK